MFTYYSLWFDRQSQCEWVFFCEAVVPLCLEWELVIYYFLKTFSAVADMARWTEMAVLAEGKTTVAWETKSNTINN